VVDAFTGLAEHAAATDTDQLATALQVLGDLTRNTPEEFRSTLHGVSGLSRKVAARDRQINELLHNLQHVSGVLASCDQDVVQLMSRAAALFTALDARRKAIHNLLTATASSEARSPNW
jgi:phospholipid/cholesterol/gamma-HCH transport system substrate-binding protein